jgi:Fic-DOC domain mobile mystery protein B
MINYPEGATPLDPDEIEGLKHKHITTRGELDHLEQANIQSGLQWMRKSRKKDILNEKFVRDLHRKLFGDVWKWAGIYRTTEKSIGVDPREIAVKLRMLLDDARYWIDNATYSPEQIAIRFHHRLVSIHLFPNGNGRHARIMSDALLIKVFGKQPIDWAGGHDLQAIGARRKEYIIALQTADQGNYAPLLAFIGLTNKAQ